MRILVAEDTRDVGEAITACLSRLGHAVDWQLDGHSAAEALRVQRYDLAVLDIMLPGRDGMGLLAEIRARKDPTPVLVLTARSQVDDRVSALDRGADDYLIKPFDFREFEARVRALLRRKNGPGTSRLEFADVCFDLASRIVTVNGVPAELTRREGALLEILLARPGKVFAKQELLDQLFGFGQDSAENAVELYVGRLRRKLAGSRISIRTLRGIGYRLEDQ